MSTNDHSTRTATRRVRHKNRGTIYTVVGEATLQTTYEQPDDAPVVVYRGDDGQLWVRPLNEFEDGRFEEITNDGPNENATIAQTADRNEWRETVRDIYDEVVYRYGHSAVGRLVISMIEERHPSYFVGKAVTNG
jgi:hypothetical protein